MDWFLLIRSILFVVIIFYLIHIKTKNLATKDEIKDIDILKNRKRDHFYTINEDERIKAIQKYGYKDEKIACYVLPVDKNGKKIEGAEPVPLYRLWAD